MKLLLALILLTGLCEQSSHALGGHRISKMDMDAACKQAAVSGFKEWKQPNWQNITRGMPNYKLVMPVNFVAYNQRGWLNGDFADSDAERYLEQLRDTYRGCGIDVELHSLKYVEGPAFLNSLDRNFEDLTFLGAKERCLFTPLHVDNEINVYFVEGVGSKLSVGRSHAWLQDYLVPQQSGDYRFIGAAVVTTYDRSNFSTSHAFVVPHEVGHVVMNMGHTSGIGYNLMADSANLLSYYVTDEQCQRARNSPFVKTKESLKLLPALAPGRRAD